jgi:hypothetical protein
VNLCCAMDSSASDEDSVTARCALHMRLLRMARGSDAAPAMRDVGCEAAHDSLAALYHAVGSIGRQGDADAGLALSPWSHTPSLALTNPGAAERLESHSHTHSELA